MKQSKAQQDLRERINRLENQARHEQFAVKEEFNGLLDNLKPLNLIKHTVSSTFSAENKQDLLRAAVGIGTGLLSKKLFVGRSAGLIRRLFGSVLQVGVSGVIAQNADRIKEKGGEIIGRWFRKKAQNTRKARSL